MSITATEFKNRMSYYIELSATEDIYITQYGKVVAKLTKPFQNKMEIVESLVGAIPDTMTLEQAKELRASEL